MESCRQSKILCSVQTPSAVSAPIRNLCIGIASLIIKDGNFVRTTGTEIALNKVHRRVIRLRKFNTKCTEFGVLCLGRKHH